MVEEEKRSAEEDLINDLRRLQADFENYRKRVDRDKELHRQLATESLVQDLLPIADNLSLVLAHAKTNPEELVHGVQLTRQQLLSILESRGVEEVATERFDPELHEAVATVQGEKPGTIVHVHQPGYRLGSRVLRPARVTVTKEGNHEQAAQ